MHGLSTAVLPRGSTKDQKVHRLLEVTQRHYIMGIYSIQTPIVGENNRFAAARSVMPCETLQALPFLKAGTRRIYIYRYIRDRVAPLAMGLSSVLYSRQWESNNV